MQGLWALYSAQLWRANESRKIGFSEKQSLQVLFNWDVQESLDFGEFSIFQ